MDGNGYVSADQLIAAGRKDVTLPSGIKVKIMRVGYSAIAQIAGHLPDLMSLLDEQASESVTERLSSGRGAGLEVIDRVVVAGTLIPCLYMDPKEGATPQDLDPEDRLALFTEILSHAGYNRRAAEEIRP